MVKALVVIALLGAMLLPGAAPVEAGVYHITLHNGGRIQSREAPKAAGYAPDRLLVLTEVGNWVALAHEDIESIKADTETRGFGMVLDTTTISLGWAPNDKVEAEDLDPQERLLQLLEQRNQPRPDYSVEQFAEPSQSGGIPIWMTGVTTPPLGAAGGGGRPISGNEPQQ